MEISTIMMTSAAISAVRKPPIRFVPPTISAIGLAISEKLMVAPPIAIDRTKAEMKKLTSDDDERMDIARSWPLTMSSYSCMCRWIRRDVHGFLVILFDTIDRFAQGAMQRRVVCKVFAYRFVDAIELALDDAFLRLAAIRKQHLTFACRERFLGTGDAPGRKPERAVQPLRLLQFRGWQRLFRYHATQGDLFLPRFFDEVIRRKVLPVAVAYAIGGWVLLQVGDVLIGLLELPGWLGKVLVAVVAVGLPIA